MLNIMDMLSDHLGYDKLKPHETRRLIKDVSNIIGRREYYESFNLKPALKMLGWKEDILDYRTLELICVLLENQRDKIGIYKNC